MAGEAARRLLGGLRLTYSLGLLLGLLAVLAAGGIGLAGALWPDLDLVNHFRPFLLLAAAAGLVGVLIALPRWRIGLAALALASLLLQGAFVLPVYLARAGHAAAAEDGALRFVTLNLHYTNRDVAPAVAFLRETAPDLVFLQEVSATSLPALQAGLADLLPHALHCVEGRYCNLAILSRHPLEAVGASYIGRRKTMPEMRLAEGDWQLVTEVLPDRPNAAAGLAASIDLGQGRRLEVLNVHMSWPYPAAIQRRQFGWVAARLHDLPAGPRLLAGDFNATPWSFGLRGFDRQVPDMQRATQGQRSWPTEIAFPFPLVPIDQVYAGGGLRVLRLERGPNVGSDHFPILAGLSLDGGGGE